jgi:3-hydroxymyristoyl/3-hydroxydecanoyl-(acyl carrier protein) dehydratase
MSDTASSTVRVGADHPSLPGHFPGRPIVPGVVLLDLALAHAERAFGPVRAAALPQAKFLAPLLPEQDATLELVRDGAQLRFAWRREGQLLAQGAFTLAAP